MTFKTDRGTYLPSATPVPLPPAGGSFIDGLSGVKISRLTDELDGAGFGTTYSIWPTANCNATRLYILNSATNTYYTAEFDPASGTRIGQLRAVPSLPARHYSNYESALWSGSDPDKLFLFVDAKLYAFQPSTQVSRVVKDLTPILGVDYSFRQQHKSLDDKRFAASGPLGFVVYDVEQDRVLLDVRTTDMNGIALDRSGKWLLYVPDDDHTEFVYNVETGAREELRSDRNTGLPDFTVGHLDVGTDVIAGNDRWGGAITLRKFSTPHAFTRPFVYASTGWFSHHVSMTATDENWALLSTYLDIVGPRDANGKPIPPFDPDKFKDEVFQIGIQGEATGKIRRLFHHRALANETDFGKRYWQIPKANISRDGRFVFFTSNMGGSRNDLYVADLGTPSGATTSPTPAPGPSPTPAPTSPTKTPSPDGTKATSIVDGQGASWTLGSEKQTLKDGVHAGNGAGVIYKSVGGVVHVLGTDSKTWYKWADKWVEVGAQEPGGTAASPTPTPTPTPTPVPVPVPPAPITTPEVRKVPWPTTETKQNSVVAAQWQERYRFKRHLSGAYAEFEKVNK